jgi:TPR repeat protein
LREGHYCNQKTKRRNKLPVCCVLAILLSISNLALAAAVPFQAPADKTLYRLAEQNDPSAQYLIGRKFFTGNGVEQNINAAIKWFELAATQKHTKAQFQLGILYLYGKSGIKPNHLYALNYLREAAKSHYAEAQFELGNYYLMGKTENVNYSEAVKWYRAAAEQQHVRAMMELGKILNEGRGGIKRQPDEAKHFLSLAAESGNAEAMEYLRDMVRNTSTTFTNAASITDFNAKLNDAAAGHIPSQYEVGMAYLKGIGVDADMRLAAKWLRRAAMNDHADAQYKLSQLYRDGVGIKKNRRRALEWLKIAASAGVRDAQKELLSMHLSNSTLAEFEDLIVDSNEDTSPTQSKSDSAMAFSANSVSATSASLESVSENAFSENSFSKIREPITTSNASKSEPLQTTFLSESTTVKKDSDANAGSSADNPKNDLYSLDLQPTDADKQYLLASRYLSGENLYQDASRAAYWYEQAAKQNHAQAQFQLGEMYKHGTGVTASVAKAKLWLSKAANAGISDAEMSLRDLSEIKISSKVNVMKTGLPVTERNTIKKSNINSPVINHNHQANHSTENATQNLPRPLQNEPNVQANTGMINALGKSNPTAKNANDEIQALIEAANNNELDAQVKLAEMYRKGRGVKRDLITAAQWYEKAATEGDAEAQFNLGDMYKQGLGVDKNNALAIKWLRKAANQGHEAAKRRLGGCRIC